ncbi:MAG TPA: ATP-grasp domain-containing protein, partial [Chitinophagaceae bacterium]|nr:ATP-grasp domain-containing protein [Chitinophagaceae bacterium]
VKAFQQELTSMFPAYKVFASDMNPQMSPACMVADRYFSVRRVTDPLYPEELLALALENNVKMIVPTIDTELMVLAANKEHFKLSGIDIVVSDQPLVDICRDKRKTNLFFTERNFAVPAPVDRLNPVFPLFIKPFNGSLSKDTYLVRRREELLDHHLSNEGFLFMEYLDREEFDEYTVDLYYTRSSQLACAVPRKRIVVRAGEVSKAITSKNEIVQMVNRQLAYIPGATGCLTAQFFLNKNSGQVIAIEMNARFGGGYPLSYLAGANYPKWLIEEYYQHKRINYFDGWEDQLLMLRYDAELLVHANTN